MDDQWKKYKDSAAAPVRVRVSFWSQLTAKPDQIPPQPGISILHLMVFTATMGISFAIGNYFRSEEEMKVTRRVLEATYSMIAGAAYFGFFLAAERWFRKSVFPVHVGHWLLMIQALRTATHLFAFLVLKLVRDQDAMTDEDLWTLHVVYCLAGIFNSSLFLVAAITTRQGLYWTILFLASMTFGYVLAGSQVLSIFIESLHQVQNWLHVAFAGFTTALTILCVVIEIIRSTRRDWAHYLGVAVFLALEIQYVAFVSLILWAPTLLF